MGIAKWWEESQRGKETTNSKHEQHKRQNGFCMRASDMEYLDAVTIREDAVLHIGTGRVQRQCSGIASYQQAMTSYVCFLLWSCMVMGVSRLQ